MRFHNLRVLSIALAVCLLISLFAPTTVLAEETAAPDSAAEATDISGKEIVTDHEGFSTVGFLFNDRVLEGDKTAGNASITFEYEDGMGSLYLIFNRPYGEYTVTDNGTGNVATVGQYGFCHEFIDLVSLFGAAPTSVTVSFENGSVHLFEIDVYTEGEVPASVQKWNPPADGKADLVLLSTHGDDEQLFFAGVLPYYAKEKGYTVQVVYFTDHDDKPHRMHEMLNGLWAVGVDIYPVFGDHPDFFKRNMDDAYAALDKLGYPRESLLSYVVENLRRFQPLVVVGHDINGEYGHALHKVYTDLLMDALEMTADETQYPESAEKYGTWDVPKTYLHSYEENQLIMDWDQPLESFDGMTAFEVTKNLGYPCHKSQYSDFAWYLAYYDSAAECPKYNPCYYGLFRSTVGEDVEKKDFFENLTSHTEMDRIAEEQRLEAERIAAEEEAARIAAEEASIAAEEARIAEEQRLQEEAKRKAEEEARLAEEARISAELHQEKQDQTKLFVCIAAEASLLFVLIFLLILRFKRKS